MRTINAKTRGECAYCGRTPYLRKDGTLRVHRAAGLPSCPGTGQTPDATIERCTARDATGTAVKHGQRVMLGSEHGAPVGIVAAIEWDHPDDTNRGVAWLTVKVIRDLPEGDSVATRQVTRRSTRVWPENYDGYTVTDLLEWARELSGQGYPVPAGPGAHPWARLRGYALLAACQSANDNRRRVLEITNLAPLGSAPMMPGVRLAMGCGCAVESTSPLLADSGPDGTWRGDPALYVEGVFVAVCNTRRCGNFSVDRANVRTRPDGGAWRFYLHNTMVTAPAPTHGHAPAVFWQAYAAVVESAGRGPASLVHLRSAIIGTILADPAAHGAASVQFEDRSIDTGSLGRSVVASWRDFEEAITRGAPSAVLDVHRRRIARRVVRFDRATHVSPASN